MVNRIVSGEGAEGKLAGLTLQRKVVSACTTGTMRKRCSRPLNAVRGAPNTRQRPDERVLPLYARKRLSHQELRSEGSQYFAL